MDTTTENSTVNLADALKPWTPPFRYETMGGYVMDANDQPVADMRGWGYLTGKLKMDASEALSIQDPIGVAIADFLTSHAKHEQPSTPSKV